MVYTPNVYTSYDKNKTFEENKANGAVIEQSFGVFTVTSDTIYETKIGAGDDRVISY